MNGIRTLHAIGVERGDCVHPPANYSSPFSMPGALRSSPAAISAEVATDQAIVCSIKPSTSCTHGRLIQCCKMYSLVMHVGVSATIGVISLLCDPLPRST